MDGDIRMFDVASQDDANRDRKWRVVMTNTNAERTAKANIQALGFETYLPMAVTERPRSARRPAATFVRPFLRGYLFVRFDTRRDDWGALFTTIGIKGILRAGGVPLSVPDAVIASIRQQEEAGLIKLSDPSDVVTWRKGQSLALVGPKADIDVVFEELLDGNRAVVFVTLLGRITRQVVSPLLLK